MRLKDQPYTAQTDYNLVLYGFRMLVQLWPLWIAPGVYLSTWRVFLGAATSNTVLWWAPLVSLFAVALLVPVTMTLKRLRMGTWNSVDAASVAVIFAFGYNMLHMIHAIPWSSGINVIMSSMYFTATQLAVHAALAFILLWSLFRFPAHKWLPHVLSPHEDGVPKINGVVTAPEDSSVQNISASDLEAMLNKRVIGQEVIAAQTAKSIARRLAQRRRGKPVFTGLFAGPTGVGKTELAKTVSVALFGSEDAMFRVDCGNVMGEAGLQTLIGAPTGYIGSDKPGALTAHVTRFPQGVILFDEIEKAASNPAMGGTQSSPLFRLLLSLLDEGRFTEQSTGRTVDASGCVILMTSNAAHLALGDIYKRYANDIAALTRATKDELQSVFAPEFLARVDLVTCFSPLDNAARSKIIVKQITRLASQYDLAVASVDAVIVSRALAQWQVLEKYGTREVNRWIEDQCADALIAAKKAGFKRVDLGLANDAVTALKAA